MNILTRYILRQNLFLLLLICGIGMGVFIFVELFDRLDEFLDAGVGAATIVSYFVYRTPFILSQIFPAVFLIALMVQLGLMLIGGGLYTAGVFFYMYRKLPRSHFIWHLFVIAGSTLHFFSVLHTLPA